MNTVDYTQKTLRQININLYQALTSLLMSHPQNEGLINYDDKNLSYISDDLDLIEVNYLGYDPDSENQQRIFDDEKRDISDVEAFLILTTRLKNTDI